MRAPADFGRSREARRLAGNETADRGSSAAAVYRDIGLVLAAFLGLALTITAALTAFGIG